MKPELPPRPPDGSGLPRYGLRWNGALPLPVPMPDGFWTPWHLALARVAELEGDIKTLFRLGQVKYVRDHACGQCLPEGGDLVREGFVCAYHQCAALVGKEAKP